MALVINQTPDIQEQVAELLAALRRLQDIEVTIEVRFITISEDFYERIGVDFNLNVVNRRRRSTSRRSSRDNLRRRLRQPVRAAVVRVRHHSGVPASTGRGRSRTI